MWSILLRERKGGGRRPVDALPERRSARPRASGDAPSPWRPRLAAASAASLAAAPVVAAATPWPDPRRLTPRQIVALSHRLYMAGHLGFDDSRLLSCQAELHPDYATSVARLTARAAAPDAPRDHLEHWERRLAFALRFAPQDDERIDSIRRIVAALERLAAPPRPLRSPLPSPSPCRVRE